MQSQLYGGMIWGLSFALHEGASVDRRSGRIMNADLGEYRVPVNADAPSLEALLVPEDDAFVNGLGVKGVGEIGITGTVGAIANAVWHATGVRVREFPIRDRAHHGAPICSARAIEGLMEAPGTDRIGDERARKGAGPGFVEPVLPGRGINGFKVLRRIFRAAATCRGATHPGA